MEGLIKIRVEGDERQPVATCSLDEAIESRGQNLRDTVMDWIKAYANKHHIHIGSVQLSREGGDFRFILG